MTVKLSKIPRIIRVSLPTDITDDFVPEGAGSLTVAVKPPKTPANNGVSLPLPPPSDIFTEKIGNTSDSGTIENAGK